MMKVPLSYVIHENVAIPDANTDPAFGMPNSKYVSVLDEMIGRAPIRNAADDGYEQSYLVDREKVWDLMTKICASYPKCWTYIKTAVRARDGRAAYEAVYTQYLGPHNVDNMADAAERKLSTLMYQGETKRWNFEKYCRAHTEQHQILTNLIEHGHSGIDERSKVRHFMNGIKGNMFDTVRLQIDVDNDLQMILRELRPCTLISSSVSSRTKAEVDMLTSRHLEQMRKQRIGASTNFVT